MALTKVRKLVERDRVHAVVGIVLSAAAIAVKDYVNAQKVPLPNPYVFRLTYTGAMTAAPIGQWAYRSLKARRAAIIASDSVGPIENIMAWARSFEEAGGKVVCRYGALAQLTVWIDGQVLCIDSDMRKDVPDDVARSTIRAYNDFLERATGYTAKERAKKAQERAKARSFDGAI